MNSLKEGLKTMWEKIKGLEKKLKIALIVTLATFFIAIISMFFYSAGNKYKVLFSKLDPYDAQVVTQKLNEQKVDMKVEGDTILVPKEQVDELRLTLAPDLSNGSKGYELLDTQNSFGMTDEEFKLRKLRMLQGELEKTIKSFPQVEDTRVHITEAKDSVFVTDKEPGKAAVYLKIKPGNTIEKEQVKSIVALVSGSTDNIPKENIEVIDDNMNLLSENLEEDKGDFTSADAIQTQLSLEKQYEQTLEKSIIELLTPVVGKNKVKAAVNADLDFDSKEKTQTVIDPSKVIISQHSTKEQNNSNDTNASGSPVDENMVNTIDNNQNQNTTSSKEEETTNYETGKSEEKTISAPGEVRTLNASVIVDGILNPDMQTAIENAVQAAIGLKSERGDKISVVGVAFDPSVAEGNDVANPFADNNKSNLFTYIALAILGLSTVILSIIIIIGKRKKNKGNRKNKEQKDTLLDIVIEDKIEKIKEEPLAPLDLEVQNEQMHLEQEIKKYASDKPEQVVEIIKSWLAESER